MEDIMANFDPNEYKPPSGPNGMPDMGEMPPEEDDADSDDEGTFWAVVRAGYGTQSWSIIYMLLF